MLFKIEKDFVCFLDVIMPEKYKSRFRELDWDNIWITWGLADDILFAQKTNNTYKLLDLYIEEKDGEIYQLLRNFCYMFNKIEIIAYNSIYKEKVPEIIEY